RKCQFCKKIPPGKNSIKIYSAWNVRSCRKCIESRFSSVPPPCELPYEELLVDKTPLSKYNKKFENCKFYLKSDVDSARNEYNALLPEKRDEWRTKKSNAYQRKLRDILLRKDKIREYKGYQAEYEKGAQDHRLKLLTSKCKEMENENNPYTGEKFNFIILQKCQAYKDACKSKEEMTDRRWGYLRKKLIEQHSDFISNKK
ncbi:9328_t:CDS:1, partial [Rhizophagus irregularis]